MKGDILEGYFLLEPSKNPLGECTIQAMNFAFAVVQIKMEDNCWYQVMLQKSVERICICCSIIRPVN